MIYRMTKTLITVMLFLTTGLVYAGSPFEAFFEQYEYEFRQEHPYVAHQIDRGGHQLHAREFGVGNSGPTIIMMHGFPDSLHLYDLIAPEVADDRHVVVFDFLGWGESDKPAGFDYTIAEQIVDLNAVIDHFNLQSVVLVMHDASGPPAIDWALDNKDKVAGLILLNTYYSLMETLIPPDAVGFYATPGPARDAAVEFMSNNDDAWIQGYTDEMAKFFAQPESKSLFSKILAHQSLAMRPAYFSLTAKLFPDVVSRVSAQASLVNFDLPVRIIFGTNDPYLNVGVASDFHALFPDSELFLISGGGHFVQLDKPEKVADLIEDFLEDEDDKDDDD